MSVASSTTPQTRGVVYVHSVPRALCSHVEWTIGGVLGTRVDVDWRFQPVQQGMLATELYWEGPLGTGATLASALRAWDQLRFEVSEDPTASSMGSRHMFTPSLGLFHAAVDGAGNVQLGEDRVRFAMETSGRDVEALRAALDTALGTAWDNELEAFRHVGDSASIFWLHSAS